MALLAAAAAIAVAAVPVAQPNAWTLCPAPGKFITCLLATDAALWVGTEDQSVWRLDLKADPTQPAAWRQFGTADTKTDNVYGLAQDAAGRIWVGTQNQGVSVYNGQSWKNYGVIDGPIGEHIFSIAADPDPKRGTVWIATDHGLTSWTPSVTDIASVTPSLSHSVTSLAPDIWRSYTRGDGLPADQIYAVTVAANGRVWIGTECDGLAWSDPPYKTWTSIRAAAERSGDAPGQNGRAAIGFQPGLPSNLTNGLLALPDGSIAYSTNYGLGLSRDGGRSWTAWQGVSNMAYENYLRGLSFDPAGGLWMATRHKGLVRLDLKTGRATGVAKPALPDDYVFDVAITRDGSIWAGTYGGGLARLGPSVPGATGGLPASVTLTASEYSTAVPGRGAVPDAITGGSSAPLSKPVSSDTAAAWKAFADAMAGKTKSAAAPVSTEPAAASPTTGPVPSGLPRPASTMTIAAAKPVARDPTAPPLLPAPVAPPSLEELNAMLAALAKVPYVDPANQPAVVRVGDDWLTKGDCLGRYGRYWGCWCAILSPCDYVWGAGPEKVDFVSRIGTHCRKWDGMRYWVTWLYTQNPNSLEMPPTYFHSRVLKGYTTWDFPRCQAEWDDHGETYPMSQDGPDLYCNLKIPAGQFYLSLYNFNKDGHGGANRYRDFRLSVRLNPEGKPLYLIKDFSAEPELAAGRMRDFWGSAYTRYLVCGPAEISAKVDRNHSFCTILAGVFLDLVDEEPLPYFHDLEEWNDLMKHRAADLAAIKAETAAARAARFKPGDSEAEAAARLFQELERTRLSNITWWATEGRRFYAPLLRQTVATQKASPTVDEKKQLLSRATTCYYQLALYQKWEEGERTLGKRSARTIEKALRWDGVTPSCQGKGFEIVSKYLGQ